MHYYIIKIRNYGNVKTLRNIYFAILDSHLGYSCIVWAQNVKTASIKYIIKSIKYFLTKYFIESY